jgi:hypothetical protein
MWDVAFTCTQLHWRLFFFLLINGIKSLYCLRDVLVDVFFLWFCETIVELLYKGFYDKSSEQETRGW